MNWMIHCHQSIELQMATKSVVCGWEREREKKWGFKRKMRIQCIAWCNVQEYHNVCCSWLKRGKPNVVGTKKICLKSLFIIVKALCIQILPLDFLNGRWDSVKCYAFVYYGKINRIHIYHLIMLLMHWSRKHFFIAEIFVQMVQNLLIGLIGMHSTLLHATHALLLHIVHALLLHIVHALRLHVVHTMLNSRLHTMLHARLHIMLYAGLHILLYAGLHARLHALYALHALLYALHALLHSLHAHARTLLLLIHELLLLLVGLLLSHVRRYTRLWHVVLLLMTITGRNTNTIYG